jgi:hypothetical protein
MRSEYARTKVAEYAARADDAFDEDTRRFFLELRASWTRLAESLEFDDADGYPTCLAA